MSTVRLSEFIKAYDVRGLVPEQLSTEVARAIGTAFADVVVAEDAGPAADAAPEAAGERYPAGVVVGYDMRPSSPELARAFAEGVAARGHDVTIIGLCSTDGLYYASGALDQAGAMFTASHNPAQYNGIKLCRPGARPVGQDSGLAELTTVAQDLLDRGAAGDAEGDSAGGGVPAGTAPGAIAERPMLADYAAYLRGLVDLRGIRPLKVVVDAGNGMAGLTVPAVLEGLPLDVVPLYFELDGTFPNHEANPLDPANLVDLQRAVVEHHADLGLAFDGDADRCFVVDERGEPVSPSAITALVATREIAKHVAAGGSAGDVNIVYNVISSAAVPQIVAEHGARSIRTRVGHSFIKARMAAENAVFGGEHSAHYYFREFWFADTGMLAALHVLAALGEQDGPLSELVAEFSRYVASGEINSRVASVDAALRRVREWSGSQLVDVDELDGLTVTGRGEPMWWFNVRPSNTEPLLRLNAEAADQATMEHVRDNVLGLIRGGEVGASAATAAPAAQADAGGVPAAPGGPPAGPTQPAEPAEPAEAVPLPAWLREILVCPAGKHPLVDAVGPDGTPELVCTQDCGGPGVRRAYRIDDGIPILLIDEARLVTPTDTPTDAPSDAPSDAQDKPADAPTATGGSA